MLVIEPWDAKACGDASLADLRGVIAGVSVSAVRYVVPQGKPGPKGTGRIVLMKSTWPLTWS